MGNRESKNVLELIPCLHVGLADSGSRNNLESNKIAYQVQLMMMSAIIL